jgi:tetratricopeptide (TPR) repeat protein
MRQGNYDQAEAALTEAARIDPKFWNARFNMAEIPFLKKDWAEARKRFEQLLSTGTVRSGKGSFAADPIQDLADLSNGGQKQHGRFHSGQAGAFARYTRC